MEKEIKIAGKGKNLKDFIRLIDPNIKYNSVLGLGDFGLVLKVNIKDQYYRLKISKVDPETGSQYSLEDEYNKLVDLSKTGAVFKPIKLYEEAPAVHIDQKALPFHFYDCGKGKNAYVTEFIEGEPLNYVVGELSEFSLELKLNELMTKIHKGGYEFGEESDLSGKNILLGNDGNLYLLDPMMVLPRKESYTNSELTEEERTKIQTIMGLYGLKD